MKKKLIFCVLAFVAVLSQSCDWWIDPDEPTNTTQYTIGAYILNSGNYGSNNALLSIFSTLGGTMVDSCFMKVNNRQLGDCGQDMHICGSKLYIAMYGSGKITVVNKSDCKLLGEIIAESPETGHQLSPRRIIDYGGAVYVTYYEGYVGKIDTTSFHYTLAKVGDNPEALVVASNKLYVANSGGMNYPDYGNTLSVLNPTDLSFIKEIEVAINPCYMETDDDGDIYLVSMGNYADVSSCMQRITSSDDRVAVLPSIENPFLIAKGVGNQMVVVTSYFDQNWTAHYNVYNFNTKSSVEASAGTFISDGTTLDNIYSVSIDKNTGAVYFGISDYLNNGDVIVYSYNGTLVTKFESGGLNPAKVEFVRDTY